MFHIDSVDNTKHLENVLDYITENGRDTWLGDVTVACADGTIRLNLLTAGLIFPGLNKIEMVSFSTNLCLIVPEIMKAEIRLETINSVVIQEDITIETVVSDIKMEEHEGNTISGSCIKESNFSCEKCETICKSRISLDEHTKHSHIPMKCQICRNDEPSWWHLIEHLKVHAPVNSTLLCSRCRQSFSSKDILEKHFPSCQRNKNNSMCEDCGKTFKGPAHLKDHKNAKHLKVKPYKCSECPYVAVRLARINQHIKIAHGEGLQFICSSCGRAFKEKGPLKAHEQTHDENRIKFSCTFESCGKVYSTKCALKEHMDESHINPTIHKCKLCPSAYKSIKGLRTHVGIHDENKALVCDICDKRFSTRQELTYHMNIHTGNKPFECQICYKSYGSHSSLYHHKKACTKIIGES